VLTPRTIQVFVVWLVGCAVATYLNVWEVGNAAHVTGLLFGAGVAGAFAFEFRPRLMRAGLAALVVGSIIPLFWCPWSVAWLCHKAYKAHTAKRYAVALDRYTDIIRLDPTNAWAYLNRSSAYLALGQSENAQADWQRAHELDASIGGTK
jgi:rhomboid protease GluP